MAAERPRPATIWAISPPKEWPTTAGFLFSAPITSAKWSATWPTPLPAKACGLARASSTVAGSSGQLGDDRRVARLLEEVAQRCQLLASSQSPWTNTTGVRAARVRRLDLLCLALA